MTVVALPGGDVARPSVGLLGGPPAWLSSDAKRAWRSLAPALEAELGSSISPLDAPMLALMLEHYSVAVAAAREMRDGPRGRKPTVLTSDQRGAFHKHPAAQVLRDHANAFRNIAREFAMTPRARALFNFDAGPPPLPDDDGDDDLFAH